jgi:hypothetical protein
VFVVTTLVVGTSCSESNQTTKVVTTSPDADFLSSLFKGEELDPLPASPFKGEELDPLPASPCEGEELDPLPASPCEGEELDGELVFFRRR